MFVLTEEEGERARELLNELYGKIHALVDTCLANEPENVEEAVRQQLTEEFRFWKRLRREQPCSY